MTIVLGISAYYHESSACLVSDEKGILGYLKEESITRVKGDNSFPLLAIKEILKRSKTSPSQIDKVVFYERPLSSFLGPFRLSAKYFPRSLELISNQFTKAFQGPLALSSDLTKVDECLASKLIYIDHHLSHLYTALAQLANPSSVCGVVVDGYGDHACTSIYAVENLRQIRLLWQSKLPDSIGLFYSAITDYLGFEVNEGEYKVMGLAAYGMPEFQDRLTKLIHFEDGNIKLNMEYFSFQESVTQAYSENVKDLLGIPPREPGQSLSTDDDLFQAYANLACSAQALVENLLVQLFKFSRDLSGYNSFVFCGGVAMNSASIRKIVSELNPKAFTISWSPGDAGSSIGAAFWALLKYGQDLLQLPLLSDPFISTQSHTLTPLSEEFDSQTGLRKISSTQDSLARVASLIGEGKVVATCVGKAEIGPRALGHRSLLCDGSSHTAVTYMNEIVKGRTSFRPTAPATTLGKALTLYSIDQRLLNSYRVMGATVAVPSDSPAYTYPTTHIDKTARLQIVDEPSLLASILELCGPDVPVLANTSFNISSDPTVSSHIDAVAACLLMGIEYILVDDGLYQVCQ